MCDWRDTRAMGRRTRRTSACKPQAVAAVAISVIEVFRKAHVSRKNVEAERQGGGVTILFHLKEHGCKPVGCGGMDRYIVLFFENFPHGSSSPMLPRVCCSLCNFVLNYNLHPTYSCKRHEGPPGLYSILKTVFVIEHALIKRGRHPTARLDSERS